MQEFEQAMAIATRLHRDLHVLMRGVKQEVGLVEARLGGFVLQGGGLEAGALQRLLADVMRHYARATALGSQALTLAAAGCENTLPMLERLACLGRNDPQAVQRLGLQARRALELFANTQATVHEVAERAERDLDRLRETALRCDLPAEVDQVCSALIRRLRTTG